MEMLMLMMRLKMTIIELSNEGTCMCMYMFLKSLCLFFFGVAEMLTFPYNCHQKLILEFPFLHQISPDFTADDDTDYNWRGRVR